MGLPHGYAFVWGYTVLNVVSAMLIAVAADGFLAPVFRNRLVDYFGKISYGVYVFHFPLTKVSNFFAFGWFHGRTALYVNLALDIALAVFVAGVSFRWLESPILAAKERWFPRPQSQGSLAGGDGRSVPNG
jgi:peptidoglycan/LPS O-acetylase OafA/YrhL